MISPYCPFCAKMTNNMSTPNFKMMSKCMEALSETKDITFKFRESLIEVKANKIIIQAVSPTFKSMFSGAFNEIDSAVIHDIKPEIFQMLIDVIHMKPIDLQNVEDAIELLVAADMYIVDEVKNVSQDFLVKACTIDNLFFLYKHATFFKLPKLIRACHEMVCRDVHYKILLNILFGREKLTEDDFMMYITHTPNNHADIYEAIEYLVEIGEFQTFDYRKALSKIDFLSWEKDEIYKLKLLTAPDKLVIISRIVARELNTNPIVQLPDHLSSSHAKTNAHADIRDLLRLLILLMAPVDYFKDALDKMQEFYYFEDDEGAIIRRAFKGKVRGQPMTMRDVLLLKKLLNANGQHEVQFFEDHHSPTDKRIAVTLTRKSDQTKMCHNVI